MSDESKPPTRRVAEPHDHPVRLTNVEGIEYFFGTGDGALSTWHSPADADLDGDGVLDAVSLDFDGDGLTDDVMWDSDGDGRADRVVLDLNDDGTPETVFADSGLGLWELPRGGAPTSSGTSTGTADGSELPRRLEIDDDGDGVPDQVLEDTDGDGFADAAVSDSSP